MKQKKRALSYLTETNHLSIREVQYYYSCMKVLLVTSGYGLELILHVSLSEWTFAFIVLRISLVWVQFHSFHLWSEDRSVFVTSCYLANWICTAAQTPDYADTSSSTWERWEMKAKNNTKEYALRFIAMCTRQYSSIFAMCFPSGRIFQLLPQKGAPQQGSK